MMQENQPDTITGPVARYWEKQADGRVQCRVCPHHCTLKDGQRGRCFVRACREGELVLTTYGRSSGFCVDPIEKKPLYHFLPGTPILSFGTAGCNLRCRFCQNWSISAARQMEVLAANASPERIAQAAQELHCRSVAFTYNDPVIFPEYAIDIARICRSKDIHTVAVTAGYIQGRAREDFFQHMDAANIDLKAFSDRFYRELCGGDLQTVLDTLAFIKRETNVWMELTTLLIPGENDSAQELDEMTAWITENLGPDVPIHFSAFHPSHKMTHKLRTRMSALLKARDIARQNGMMYVYIGNVRDAAASATYCHQCGKRIIGRDGYSITAWHLNPDGLCDFCGTPCAGVFDAAPGNWGPQCMPVRL